MPRWISLLTMALLVSLEQAATQDAPPSPQFYYLEDGQIFRYDPALKTRIHQETDAEGIIYAAAVSADGRYLAYMEEAGTLRWIDRETQEITVFPPRPTPTFDWPEGQPYTSHVLPLAWSGDGKLLLNQTLWESNHLGWTSLDEPIWHDLPPRPAIPNDRDDPRFYYGCGWFAWAPNTPELLFGSGGPGHPCVFMSGLTLIDLEANTAHQIVAEQVINPTGGISLPAGVNQPSWSGDNQWIAFTMQLNIIVEEGKTRFPYGLYIARPDGTERQLIIQDTDTHYIACSTWSPSGNLAYVYLNYSQPTYDPQNPLGDLYIYQPSNGIQSLAYTNIGCPITLSPGGQYMSFFQEQHVMILPFATMETTPISEQTMGEANVIGWTME
jgi:hypothetical protein